MFTTEQLGSPYEQKKKKKKGIKNQKVAYNLPRT